MHYPVAAPCDLVINKYITDDQNPDKEVILRTLISRDPSIRYEMVRGHLTTVTWKSSTNQGRTYSYRAASFTGGIMANGDNAGRSQVTLRPGMAIFSVAELVRSHIDAMRGSLNTFPTALHGIIREYIANDFPIAADAVTHGVPLTIVPVSATVRRRMEGEARCIRGLTVAVCVVFLTFLSAFKATG